MLLKYHEVTYSLTDAFNVHSNSIKWRRAAPPNLNARTTSAVLLESGVLINSQSTSRVT